MEDGAGPPEYKHQVTNGVKKFWESLTDSVHFDKILILLSKYKKFAGKKCKKNSEPEA